MYKGILSPRDIAALGVGHLAVALIRIIIVAVLAVPYLLRVFVLEMLRNSF